ncbi:MAG: thioredoxin family protein [Cocleimonas sp.]|nr:thioredoxin family protein [Cocleimonas sp.]
MIKTLSKFFLLIFIALGAFLALNATATNTGHVIEEKNFAALAKKMKQQNKGLLLMLHSSGCAFCEALEKQYLYPSVKSGDYDKEIFIRKLQIDSGTPIIDFSGKTIDPDVISRRYDGSLTPTLLFLDYKGDEAALKMIGYNTPSLFGGYVEEQLKEMRHYILKNAKLVQ